MNVIIIHGCPDSPKKAETSNKHWMPWTKEELVAAGLHVDTPVMPNPWAPSYEAYKKEFEKYSVSEDTVLVGHSCGCAFLVRWLGESKQKIKKLILVAPWKIADQQDAFRPAFYDYPIDPSIKDRVGEIVMFTSDDEEEDGKKSLKMYHDALSGKIINLKGRGHYIFGDMKTEKFPELIDEILEDEDEEDEEEDEEESDKKSNKSGRARSLVKNMAILAATAGISAALGATAGFAICQNSKLVVAPTPMPAPSASTGTKTPPPAPKPAPAPVPPRSTPPAPPASGAVTTPPPTPADPASIPPTEPPVPPSSDGTTP